ncbi:MAG: excinuclease ABC subunit UvrA [Planctomycetaceae bacterium]|nr:excinuclease ABC subunit UvrA [Planctomycetaceae bacterium]
MALTHITIRGAREHNLKGVNLDIPRDKLVVFTGLSGSGKSSLAFDTIYAEGQRRYVESLSAYARQFLGQMEKPNVELIEGLPPTIAIEQRQAGHNPRSTVATTTEIYDHLRLLFARVGRAHCPECGKPVRAQSAQSMVETMLSWPTDTKLMVLAPVIRGKKGEHRELIARYMRDGFVRARVDDVLYELPQVPELDKQKKHTIEIVVDRVVLREGIQSRLTDSVETALRESGGVLTVLHDKSPESGVRSAESKKGEERRDAGEKEKGQKTADGEWFITNFSQFASCPDHPSADMAELEPRTFSFNSPYGACPKCHGLGTEMDFDLKLVVQDQSLSLNNGAITPWAKAFGPFRKWYRRRLAKACSALDIDMNVPWRDLPEADRNVLLHGTTAHPRGRAKFEGVLPGMMSHFQNTESDAMKARIMHYMSEHDCQGCHGGRLRPFSMAVTVGGKRIHEVSTLTISAARAWIEALKLNKEETRIAEAVVREIKSRLGFMEDVGIGYLTLDRKAGTLSGGEAQRIKLATQVGSGLVGVCYVLDEPSIGLHQRDNDMLLKTLRHLRDIGNTVIVVEHDEDTIHAADFIVDIGPRAGDAGGEIVYAGDVETLKKSDSLTAEYISARRIIPIPEKRRDLDIDRAVTIKGAKQNNLKKIDVAFPLGGLICVTGVSGSGKSTLVSDILAPALANRLNNAALKAGDFAEITGWDQLDKVIEIDQSPIGRTPRSNPATYTDIFGPIRDLFVQTREAKLRGYQPGRFSFNVPGGRCEACEGQGVKLIEMHFLPDVHVICEECKGTRYNKETLEVRWNDKTIAEVLDMRVAQALGFFENHTKIHRTLQTLADVGLDYIKLGQPSTTLSGGEAQRIKLASELGRPDTGHTFYILDEPTTGLHFHDVEKLLEVLYRLVEKGNTVLVIEHNLDVIKCADWIIDLGPGGGEAGGRIVASGSPEVVAATKDSFTGQYLQRYFKPGKGKRSTRAAAKAEHAPDNKATRAKARAKRAAAMEEKKKRTPGLKIGSGGR